MNCNLAVAWIKWISAWLVCSTGTIVHIYTVIAGYVSVHKKALWSSACQKNQMSEEILVTIHLVAIGRQSILINLKENAQAWQHCLYAYQRLAVSCWNHNPMNQNSDRSLTLWESMSCEAVGELQPMPLFFYALSQMLRGGRRPCALSVVISILGAYQWRRLRWHP